MSHRSVISPVLKERVERKSRAVAVPVMADGADKPQCVAFKSWERLSQCMFVSMEKQEDGINTLLTSGQFLCYVGMQDFVIDLSFHPSIPHKVRLICGGRGK